MLSISWKTLEGDGYTVKTEKSQGWIMYSVWKGTECLQKGKMKGTYNQFYTEVLASFGLRVGRLKGKEVIMMHRLSALIAQEAKQQSIDWSAYHNKNPYILSSAMLTYNTYPVLPSIINQGTEHPIDGVSQNIETICYDLAYHHKWSLKDVAAWLERHGY